MHKSGWLKPNTAFSIRSNRRILFLTLIVFCVFVYCLMHFHLPELKSPSSVRMLNIAIQQQQQLDVLSDVANNQTSTPTSDEKGAKTQSDTLTAPLVVATKASKVSTSSRSHIFYYAWYRNKEHDGSYDHWNHKVLPHWTPSTNAMFKNINQPSNVDKNEIGADYFPKIGLYSSLDEVTMKHHLTEIRDQAHIQTIIVSYWGGRGDDNISQKQAQSEHDYLNKLFSVAEELGVLIVFHLEPYRDRTAESTLNDARFLIDTYGGSSAFYRVKRSDLRTGSKSSSDKDQVEMPLFYVYDSYWIKANEWNNAIHKLMRQSNGDKSYDSILIGLYTDKLSSEAFFKNSGFDGFYTYFGATRFTHGSTPSNWRSIHSFAEKHGLFFIPSVAPGYIDTRIRPWNENNVRDRKNGKYYDDMWQSAIDTTPSIISVTSYNEWHEGTQIEPAVPAQYVSSVSGNTEDYKNYLPNEPDFYLKKTAEWVDKFEKNFKS